MFFRINFYFIDNSTDIMKNSKKFCCLFVIQNVERFFLVFILTIRFSGLIQGVVKIDGL
jgi:hypothetical protein